MKRNKLKLSNHLIQSKWSGKTKTQTTCRSKSRNWIFCLRVPCLAQWILIVLSHRINWRNTIRDVRTFDDLFVNNRYPDWVDQISHLFCTPVVALLSELVLQITIELATQRQFALNAHWYVRAWAKATSAVNCPKSKCTGTVFEHTENKGEKQGTERKKKHLDPMCTALTIREQLRKESGRLKFCWWGGNDKLRERPKQTTTTKCVVLGEWKLGS